MIGENNIILLDADEINANGGNKLSVEYDPDDSNVPILMNLGLSQRWLERSEVLLVIDALSRGLVMAMDLDEIEVKKDE